MLLSLEFIRALDDSVRADLQSLHDGYFDKLVVYGTLVAVGGASLLAPFSWPGCSCDRDGAVASVGGKWTVRASAMRVLRHCTGIGISQRD